MERSIGGSRGGACTASSEACTRSGRTLLDLAAVLQPTQLHRVLERAEAQRLADAVPLRELLERHRGRRGARSLREALEGGAAAARLTRSELERRFLGFLEQSGLPLPETNVSLELASGERLEVDCLWRDAGLVVELDGRAFHDIPAAFERDRRRDRLLTASGRRVMRVTERALSVEPSALREEVLRALEP